MSDSEMLLNQTNSQSHWLPRSGWQKKKLTGRNIRRVPIDSPVQELIIGIYRESIMPICHSDVLAEWRLHTVIQDFWWTKTRERLAKKQFLLFHPNIVPSLYFKLIDGNSISLCRMADITISVYFFLVNLRLWKSLISPKATVKIWKKKSWLSI